MKQRLTLTITPKISLRAKNFAQRRGLSLSALVEQLLLEATASFAEDKTSARTEPSFSARWAGKGVLSEKNDPRSLRLKSKYGLESARV
jgi:hypothetical protein